jgi:hypothetical protein
MILKIIACVAAAIPLFLFIRAAFLPGNDADPDLICGNKSPES